MTQITFMNISQFIEFCAAMTEKERTFYARNGELVEHPNTKKIHGFNFHPIILMSLETLTDSLMTRIMIRNLKS